MRRFNTLHPIMMLVALIGLCLIASMPHDLQIWGIVAGVAWIIWMAFDLIWRPRRARRAANTQARAEYWGVQPQELPAWRAQESKPHQARGRKRTRQELDRKSFGEENWGASGRHRQAALDEARLARWGLPVLATERDLAEWLGISLSRLRWFTYDRPAATVWHYVRYTIPKRSGGARTILAPKRELKTLQRKVLRGILDKVPGSPSAHGFTRGRSIVTNAQPHVCQPVVCRLDLKDFFPGITFPRVRGLFIWLGYPFSVAATLALLCTEREREEFERGGKRYYISVAPRGLVQGAPTSPALANLAAWRLDRRLEGLAHKHGFAYTRYADDLTFSGGDIGDEAAALRVAHGVIKAAQRIIAGEHFVVNEAKTRVLSRSARQVVTGLVVNDGVGTPRQARRRLRAILHNARQTGLDEQNRDGRANFPAYVTGLLGFVRQANPQQAGPLQRALDALKSR